MREKLHTSEQAATQAGISRQTLQAWIEAKKIAPPPLVGGMRVWTSTDIAKLRKVERRKYKRGTKGGQARKQEGTR